MSRSRKLFIWCVAIGLTAAAAFVLVLVRRRYIQRRPVILRGAVIRQSTDPRKQSPIADVQVTAVDGLSVGAAKSDFSGQFGLPLRPDVRPGQPVTLTFRSPDYQPLDLQVTAGDQLYVARMVPVHGEVEAELNDGVVVANVLVRFSTETTTNANVGSGARTFQVVNTGNVPCNNMPPCSPDRKWKASIASASLDAGAGNVFQNARVSCIAGPCPFTSIDWDGFSRGGRNITVSVRNWSDTTTFLLEAEVYRREVSDTVRQSYPIIFGRAMNFTLPPAAEGTSIEAELDGSEIVFPLGPDPDLSWADCNVKVDTTHAQEYRCELKPGYRFP